MARESTRPRPSPHRASARADRSNAASPERQSPSDVLAETTEVLSTIGSSIRRLRLQRGMTLQMLATATGLSSSMLSLLERGKAGPSIGTLVVIASALDTQMAELLGAADRGDDQPVTRRAAQQSYATAEGVQRRIMKNDTVNGIEIAINEYNPGTASAPRPVAHQGFEFGIVLEGALEITLNERTYELSEGDIVSYRSTDPHRIANPGGRKARALWVNLKPR
ncbi:MAG: hypothetical protein JWO26_1632 [Rhodospirillales bacterium]|jgi:transcriptional regulator with XRE-family HTH domain|nr:hypothetical protein [Rhodospirillales bacterium]MDB5382000.1 hypothetical protein [Rhodospirillales bacterium]